jgi:WD40 repeat protein
MRRAPRVAAVVFLAPLVLANPAFSAAPPQPEPLPRSALLRIGFSELRHGARIRAIAFLPEGKTLVSGSADGVVCLSSAGTGRRLRSLPVFLSRAWTTCFSRDGKLLASSCANEKGTHSLHIRDLASGNVVHHLVDARTLAGCLAFSPDGRTLAAGGSDSVVRTWDVKTGKGLHTFARHASPIHAIAFSPDGKTLASCGDDQVRLHDPATGKPKTMIGPPRGGYEAIAFSADSRFLALTRDRKPLDLWEIATRRRVRTFKGHTGALQSLAISPNGKLIAGGDGHAIHLWDLANGKLLRSLPGRWQYGGDDLAFSADSKLLAVVADNVLRLWDATTGEVRHPRVVENGPVRVVQFSANGRTLATSGGRTVCLWDATSGKRLHRFPDLPSEKLALGFGQTDKVLNVWEPSIGVRRIDGRTGKVRELWPADEKQKNAAGVSLTPDGRTLLAWSEGRTDQGLRGWVVRGDIPTRKWGDMTNLEEWAGTLATFDRQAPHAVAFSSDGRLLAEAGGLAERFIRCWDTRTGKARVRIEVLGSDRPGPIRTLAFSADGRILAAGTEEGTISVWETGKGRLIARMIGHTGKVRALAFAPDGRMVAGGDHRSIRLWEVATGRERCLFRPDNGAVSSLCFGSRGAILASGSEDTTVLLWDVWGSRSLPPAPSPFETMWQALGDIDAEPGFLAMQGWRQTGAGGIRQLQARLRPVAALDPKLVSRLLTDLDSEDFHEREAASRQLEALGDRIAGDLEKALAARPSLEVRRRIGRLVAQLGKGPSAEELRSWRAVEVLEQMGSPEAKRLLVLLAAGAADARLTREAKAALARWKGAR